jgi:hypothetical protein
LKLHISSHGVATAFSLGLQPKENKTTDPPSREETMGGFKEKKVRHTRWEVK